MRITYWMLVRTLRFAGWLTKRFSAPRAVLADAEGDSGYWKFQRYDDELLEF